MTNKQWIFVLNSSALGAVKLVNDPEGWAPSVSISRSISLYGLFRTYKAALRFTGDGYDYVRNVYEAHRTEHIISIGIYEYNSAEDKYLLYYSGVIDLSTYSIEEDKFIDADIQDGSFARKIKSRDDTKVILNRTESIDGVSLPTNKSVEVQLLEREQTLISIFELDTPNATVSSQASVLDPKDIGFTLPMLIVSSNIESASEPTNPQVGGTGCIFFGPPNIESTIRITGTIKGTMGIVPTGTEVGAQHTIAFRIYDDNTLATFSDDPIWVYDGELEPGQPVDVDIDKTLANIQPDNVIALVASSFVIAAGSYTSVFTEINLTIDQNQIFPPTNARGYLMYEAFERITQVITDDEDSFKSDFLGRTDNGYDVNGIGSLQSIHSGSQIRAIPNVNPSESLNSLFKSMNSQRNIGAGIEYNVVGKPFLRVEEKDHFFSGTVGLTLHSVSDLVKDVARDYIYSGVEVGYVKSEIEDVNGREEYNNKFNWDTFIETVKNKLDLTSTLRADGYGIEKVRQVQFATNPTEDLKEDNDNFTVVVIENGTDTDGNTKYQNARIADYVVVDNIFSPETAYNLDITPGRMLRANAGQIRAGLEKYPLEEIKFGFAEQKANLSSQKTGGELITENENIDVRTLTPGRWIPEIYNFKSVLTRESFKILERNPERIVKFSTSTEEETTKYSYGWILNIDSDSDKETSEWQLLRVNLESPDLNFIDPDGNDPNTPTVPVDPTPIEGTFEGGFPFVFVNGEIPPPVTANTYNFLGVERIVFPTPIFERTDTFIFKCRIKSVETGLVQPLYLWNTFDLSALKGLLIRVNQETNEIRVSISNAFFSNSLDVETNDGGLTDNFSDVEITYDGSSSASGVVIKINDVVQNKTTLSDDLTASASTGVGAALGGYKVNPGGAGEMQLQSFEWTQNGTIQFKTECEDNGTLISEDLSGQGNDGNIDLGSTTEEQFFIIT